MESSVPASASILIAVGAGGTAGGARRRGGVGIAIGGRAGGAAAAIAVGVCTSGAGVCVATAAAGTSGCHCELVAVVLGASLCHLRRCRQQEELMIKMGPN